MSITQEETQFHGEGLDNKENSQKVSDWKKELKDAIYDNLRAFNKEDSIDVTFDLYSSLKKNNQYEENLRKYCESFSEIYYLRCSPFSIEDRKNDIEIYEILKRYEHTANGHFLEVMIGKIWEEAMQRAWKVTEEYRKSKEFEGITINDPKKYQHLVGFFWWTSWRISQEVINDIKHIVPEKIIELKK